ncbi:hypothetical protein ACFLQZ_02045 [Acidobacteriota bacterium]
MWQKITMHGGSTKLLGKYVREIRNLGIRGVDSADVSYPGANGGAVGGSSRRERYSVLGTAPLGKET